MIWKLILMPFLRLAKVVSSLIPARGVRRRVRDGARGWVIPLYFRLRYLGLLGLGPAVKPQGDRRGARGGDTIWQFWMQGEAAAPGIVRACLASVRKHKGKYHHRILGREDLKNLVKLPDYIEEKFRRGVISVQAYSDLVRLELLYQYGGVWMDATCFMTAGIPQFIEESDFFVFHTGRIGIGTYSMFQNCFIRAGVGNALVALWRGALLEFWRHENSVPDYFFAQLMLKALVLNNPVAAREYIRMPRVSQDVTHVFCHGSKHDLYGPFDRAAWDELTAGSFFQKLRYGGVVSEGSVAAWVVSTG